MTRIGEKIKAARLEQNIPLKQIAKKCGVSESYLADVESGRRVINDEMIKKISSLLNINSGETMFFEDQESMDTEDTEVKKKPQPARHAENVPDSWQSAFSNIIKDVPIYSMDMDKILGYRKFPIIDKKIEGHNPEKIIYITADDGSMSGYRIKKDDIVMVFLNNELPGSGLVYAQYGSSRVIRYVKRLDASRVLVISNDGSMRTETCDIHGIKILGRCIRGEIDLTIV